MARYIDADVLLNKLPNDLPYKASVKRVLMQAPEVDVVPNDKVDEMLSQIEILITEYIDGLYMTGEFLKIFVDLKTKYGSGKT